MKILYFRSVWGLDEFPTIEAKLEKIKSGGFDGVELDVPLDKETCRRARRSLDDLGLAVVAQQWRTSGRSVAEHKAGFEDQYERALLLKPLYLNSHTGCDHFTLEENLALFDHAAALADRHGLPVYHETHRGRAMFSAPATMQFLAARPQLKLVADFSHWCCVHESLLADQPQRVERATQRAYAIHARIGHAEGPQIPDPRDPLWRPNLEAHLAWWQRIVEHRRAEGCDILPICPEFGPPPYMTLLPHTKEPIADLWEVNCFMRDWLKERLAWPSRALAQRQNSATVAGAVVVGTLLGTGVLGHNQSNEISKKLDDADINTATDQHANKNSNKRKMIMMFMLILEIISGRHGIQPCLIGGIRIRR